MMDLVPLEALRINHPFQFPLLGFLIVIKFEISCEARTEIIHEEDEPLASNVIECLSYLVIMFPFEVFLKEPPLPLGGDITPHPHHSQLLGR
ncbi:hypothetical protein KEJ13_02310 [Candidatus Bathyarchaeota archaeon]|nr:hypothetical protein [Candidatus Bathyarchaeota archaeon]